MSFSSGTKIVAFVAGSDDLGRGGVTINQVASGASFYEFNVGGQYILLPDRKHRAPKILGPGDGALTAQMYVALPDPERAGEGYDSIIRKGDASTFAVVVAGFDNAVAAAANAGTDIVTFTGYTPEAGDPIILDGGTAPGGLTLGVVYFARDIVGSTAKLAATVGGAAIDITSNGSGLVARKGVRTLTRQGNSIQARVTGKVTPFKWEQVADGIRSSAFGQDLANAADAAAAQALLGPVTSIADGLVVQADLQADLLETIQSSAAVPRGIGAAGTLMSAWVSGFGVTGSSPVSGITESHGLGTALSVSGLPALRSDGAVRIVCNGATSSGLLSKANVTDLLTARNILVMDVNADVAGDWSGSSLFRAFTSSANYGFNIVSTGIGAYTSTGLINSTFTPKRGRQRIGVYVEFGDPSSFRYISLGRDQNMLVRPPFKVAGTFASATQDPTEQDELDVWIGDGNLIAGRAGTHDIYGWRLLKGVPAGLSPELDRRSATR